MIEPLEQRQLMAAQLGIDVSYAQGASINWSSVASSGENFAYMRAAWGDSSNHVDDDFITNVTNIASTNLKYGYYYFSYYDLAADLPVAQGDFYWSTISSHMAADGKHLMPFLDIEDGATAEGGNISLSQWVDDFCLELETDAAKAGFSITPLVYCSSSPASSYFAAATNIPDPAQLFPIDVANYPSSTTVYTPTSALPASSPPAGTGDWPSWAMWQYSSKGSVSGISGSVDMDVLNGDANTLKDLYVQAWALGAQVTTNPQPATYSASNALPTFVKVYSTYNISASTDSYIPVDADTLGTIVAKGATKDANGNQRWQVTFSNGVTGWIVQDANYVVRNLPGRWAVGSSVTARTVTGKILQGPIYANGYERYQVAFSNGITGWDNEILMTTATPSVSAPSPASSASYLTSLPANFTWTGTNASSYDVYLDGTLKVSGLTTSSWAHSAIADGTHTWYIISHNAELSTTSATYTFAIDTAAPTATYGGQTPSRGTTPLTFTVTYTDPASGILYSSLNSGDLLVTGPNGYSQTATFVSADVASNGSPRTATYTIPAPNGSWDESDNGTYTVSQVASQVRDVAGNFRAAGSVGSFIANIPFAYITNSSTLNVDSPTSGPLLISVSAGTITATQGTSNYSFAAASISNLIINTTLGNDTLSLSGSIPVPITLTGSGGSDALILNAGAVATLATDANGYSVSVGNSASLTFSVTQHLASLSIDAGTATVPSGGITPLATSDLLIFNGGSLNLNDNSFIWNYTGSSPIESLRSYLRTGYNNGSWNGPGINSSAAQANSTHAFGYLEASDLGVSSFAGISVDSTSLLVKYTYAGDTNLDGKIDADDYALTDRAFAQNPATPHWLNGDYDYDGVQTIHDYLLLDTSSAAQSNSAPSNASLANLEAAYGPAYVSALLAVVQPDPAPAATPAFSQAAITADPAIATLAIQTPAVTVKPSKHIHPHLFHTTSSIPTIATSTPPSQTLFPTNIQSLWPTNPSTSYLNIL
jgi:GH25 family lysozyme M1 (1,4-beta-N-acetylmuramidase)